MRYTQLGTTGLEVSVVCVGCMSFGKPDQGGHPWSLDEQTSRPFLQRALGRLLRDSDTDVRSRAERSMRDARARLRA